MFYFIGVFFPLKNQLFVSIVPKSPDSVDINLQMENSPKLTFIEITWLVLE